MIQQFIRVIRHFHPTFGRHDDLPVYFLDNVTGYHIDVSQRYRSILHRQVSQIERTNQVVDGYGKGLVSGESNRKEIVAFSYAADFKPAVVFCDFSFYHGRIFPDQGHGRIGKRD